MYPVKDIAPCRSASNRETLGLGPRHGIGGAWLGGVRPARAAVCLGLDYTFRLTAEVRGAGGIIAFEVADLDRLLEELKAKDVATGRRRTSKAPSAAWPCVSIPRGNRIVLHQLKRKAGADAGKSN